MKKVVKRLTPVTSTMRALYVNSGNQCAFPDCTNKIVDGNGVFIGQVCHIEAANEGGERFNSNMTNEERRGYPNLLLLCYEHHQVTNEEEKYTAGILKNMKNEHEAKFEKVIEDMSTSFVGDITKKQNITYAETLKSINYELNWMNSKLELRKTSDSMKNEIRKLANITPATRSVFLTMLERSDHNIILIDEVKDLLNLTYEKMEKHIDILTKYCLITEPEKIIGSRGYSSELNQVVGWPMWVDIKDYCEKKSIDLSHVVYDMNFGLLD